MGTSPASQERELVATRAAETASSLPAFKILPAGDSITVGVGSSDGYGYRLALADLLTDDGCSMHFIGSQRNGLNSSNDAEEGYGFNRINQILGHMEADDVIDEKPNLVLLHAGTNDNDLELNATATSPAETYADAPTRLGNLIDYILGKDPTTVLLVAKLIQNRYNQTQTDLFNAQVPGVVADRSRAGYKIRVVDMTSVGDEPGQLSDMLHPSDAGYALMAQIWHDSILDVPINWWSQATMSTVGGQTSASALVGTSTHAGISTLAPTSIQSLTTTWSPVPTLTTSSVFVPSSSLVASSTHTLPSTTTLASSSVSPTASMLAPTTGASAAPLSPWPGLVLSTSLLAFLLLLRGFGSVSGR